MERIGIGGSLMAYMLLATDADGLSINLCGIYGSFEEAREKMLQELAGKVDAELAEMPDDLSNIGDWHNADYSVMVETDRASATYDVTHGCNYGWQIIPITHGV